MDEQQYEIIKDYLEMSYSGAKMSDDIEMQSRLARAIIAFEADIEEDIFKENVIENLYKIDNKKGEFKNNENNF